MESFERPAQKWAFYWGSKHPHDRYTSGKRFKKVQVATARGFWYLCVENERIQTIKSGYLPYIKGNLIHVSPIWWFLPATVTHDDSWETQKYWYQRWICVLCPFCHFFAKMFQILSKIVNFWTDTHRKTTFLFSRKNEICLMKWTLLVRKTRTFVPKTSYFRAVFIFHKKVYFCFTGSSCIQNTQKLLNLSKNVLFWTKCVSFLKNTPRINCLDFWKNRYSLENTWNPHGILRL